MLPLTATSLAALDSLNHADKPARPRPSPMDVTKSTAKDAGIELPTALEGMHLVDKANVALVESPIRPAQHAFSSSPSPYRRYSFDKTSPADASRMGRWRAASGATSSPIRLEHDQILLPPQSMPCPPQNNSLGPLPWISSTLYTSPARRNSTGVQQDYPRLAGTIRRRTSGSLLPLSARLPDETSGVWGPPDEHDDGKGFESSVETGNEREEGELLEGECAIGKSRCLMIEGLDRSYDHESLRPVLQALALPFVAIIPAYLKTAGKLIIIFYDSRHCRALVDAIAQSRVSLPVAPAEYIHCHGYTNNAILSTVGPAVKPYLNKIAHQVVITSHKTDSVDETSLRKSLEEIGDLESLLMPTPGDSSAWLASFYDSRCAIAAKMRLMNALVDGTHLVTSVWRPLMVMKPEDVGMGSAWTTPIKNGRSSCPTTPATPPLDFTDNALHSQSIGRRASMPTIQPESPAMPLTPRSSSVYNFPITPSRTNKDTTATHEHQSSFSTLSEINEERQRLDEIEKFLLATPRQGQDFEPFVRSKPLRDDTPPPSKSSAFTATAKVKAESQESQDWRSNRPIAFGGKPVTPEQARHKNIIYRENVPENNRLSLPHLQNSVDERTTVMIKDIPNKLTRHELLHIIEEVVPGQIDFLYLRFDFKNECNCGFAFANFVSTDALKTFAEARLGLRWNIYSSEKVLQMSYANIQGLEALVGHFRNSSVMSVEADWRPVLLKNGKELEFPKPTHDRTPRQEIRTSKQGHDSMISWRTRTSKNVYQYTPGSLEL